MSDFSAAQPGVPGAVAEISSRHLMARIGHDFRTLVARSFGALDLLANSGLDVEQRQLLHIATGAMGRQWEILQSMQDLLQLIDGDAVLQTGPIILRELIDAAVAQMVGVAGSSRPQIQASGPPDAIVYGDEERLRILLTDLLQVSCGHNRGGPPVVQVSLQEDEPGAPPTFQIALHEAGADAEDLAGLPEGSGAWVYEPGFVIYQQMSQALGLQLDYNFSNDGRVLWRLRGRSAEPAAALAPNIEVVDIRELAGKRFLVVEDDVPLSEVMTRMLESLHGEVEQVYDGREAATVCGERRYDAILMDCNMPGLDGFAATRQIRHSGLNRTTPILAVTALSMRINTQRCRAAGMDACIFKPFSRERFMQALAAVLSGHTHSEADGHEISLTAGGDLHAAPAVDEQQVRQTIELIGDTDAGLDMLQNLLTAFQNNWREVMNQLGDDWQRRDAESIRSLSHKLKSQARMLGLAKHSRLFATLEDCAERGALDEGGWQRVSNLIAHLGLCHPTGIEALEHTLHGMMKDIA